MNVRISSRQSDLLGAFARTLSSVAVDAGAAGEPLEALLEFAALGHGTSEAAAHYSLVDSCLLYECLGRNLSLDESQRVLHAACAGSVISGLASQEAYELPPGARLTSIVCQSSVFQAAAFADRHLTADVTPSGRHRLYGSAEVPFFSDWALVAVPSETGSAVPFLVQIRTVSTRPLSGSTSGTLLLDFDGEESWALPPLDDRFALPWALRESAWLTGTLARQLDELVPRCRDRRARGRPLAQLQDVQHKLADACMALDGSRLLLWKAAAEDSGPKAGKVAMARLALMDAVEAQRRVHHHIGSSFSLASCGTPPVQCFQDAAREMFS